MSKRQSWVFLAFAVTFFCGCATGPKYSAVASSFANLPSDQGRVFVYRASAMGAAVQPEIRMDGQLIGKAVPLGFFYVDRALGNHEIVTSTEVERKLTFMLESGQVRYVRLGISIGFFVGHIYPELVDTDVALSELEDCSYIGQP
jgi:hypothetical protein